MRKKLKTVFNVLQWFLTTVLVLVVLLLVFTAFNPIKSFQVLRVMSGSMEPKIKVGSVVFIQKVKLETLEESNIITFASQEDPNMSITHRLVKIEEKEGKTVFKTRGDANNSDDITETLPSQVKGKVVFSLPLLGYLSVWIRKPAGFGLLVILPAISIIISEILNIKKTIEKEVEKKYAKQEKHSKNKMVSLLLIFFLLGIGFPQIKATNAYFSDTEISSGNTFSAGVLNLTLRSGQNNFSPQSRALTIRPGESVNRDIYVGKTVNSTNLKHSVSYENTGGNTNFCQQLQLKIWYDHYHCDLARGYATCRDMRLKYNGSLTALNNFKDNDFLITHPNDFFDTDSSDGTEQWFYYTISLPANTDPSFANKTCQFNFRFKSWQENSDGSWGFRDEEILANTITSGQWPTIPSPGSSNSSLGIGTTGSVVVLNEILPNTEDDHAAKPNGEWVELYNKSDSTISVAGWYLTDADNYKAIIIGERTNTDDVEIPAHGFLVVYVGLTELTLGDSGDTISLYDDANNLIDSHTYLVTPEGKSIAHLPDGGDTWYDPIPTPGEPNKMGDTLAWSDLSSFEETGEIPQIDFYLEKGKTAVGFKVTNISQYSSLDYQILYEAKGIEKGIGGTISLNGEKEISRNNLVLGTCSKGVCVYDKGMTEIRLNIKLTDKDRKEISLNKSIKL